MKLKTFLIFATAALAAFMHANSVDCFQQPGFARASNAQVIISSLLLAGRANGMPNHEVVRKKRASLNLNLETNLVTEMTDGAETVSKIFSKAIYETVAPKLGKQNQHS